MPETYGIMVYQEDVIKVAHHFAGLSLAEADVLRRGMSGKSRSKDEFERVRAAYFENCKRLGRKDAEATAIWMQIESFAGYSFAKGHSASFAVESYQSLYLKAYFPLEFIVGVINNFGGFYSTEFYVHELRMQGAKIEAPHLNESDYLTKITGTTVYLGWIHLKHLEKRTIERLLQERHGQGPFLGLEDFVRRVACGLEQLLILIRIHAFRFTGKPKQQLLWETHFLHHKQVAARPTQELFAAVGGGNWGKSLPPQVPVLEELDVRQDILDQIDILEFPLESPFHLLQDQGIQGVKARELPQQLGKIVQVIGYLVTVKYTLTIKGEVMNFGTLIDQEGHWIDTVHFPPTVKKYPFKGRAIYWLEGKVVEEFGFYSLEVQRMERMAYWNAEG
jgi:DNA polymerase-3 subunit alpha